LPGYQGIHLLWKVMADVDGLAQDEKFLNQEKLDEGFGGDVF